MKIKKNNQVEVSFETKSGYYIVLSKDSTKHNNKITIYSSFDSKSISIPNNRDDIALLVKAFHVMLEEDATQKVEEI